MPVYEYDFEETGETRSSISIRELFNIQRVNQIISITTEPELSQDLISFEVDIDSETVEVSLRSIPYTDSRREGKTYSLSSTYVDGDGVRVCGYDGGNIWTNAPPGESCPATIGSTTTVYDFKYTIVVDYIAQVKKGVFEIKTEASVVTLPVYDPSTVNNNQLRSKVDGETVCFELVRPNSNGASPLRIMTNQGIKSIKEE